MKNTIKAKVNNIISLIKWFEEFQPEDLDQIERILTGLKYVDKDIMENNLKQDIYRNTKLIQSEKYIQLLNGLSRRYLCMDINNRYNKSK